MNPSATTSSGTGGANYGPGWECVGHFKYPDTTGKTIVQEMDFVDALNAAQPITNITMALCSGFDGTCKNPAMTGIMPDAMGKVHITEPMMPGYYLDIVDSGTTSSSTSSSSSTGGGVGMCNGAPEPGPANAIRHSVAPLGDPIIIPPNPKSIRLVTNDTLCTLAGSVGVTEDVSHTTIVVLAVDCNDKRAAGVFVESTDVDSETVERYFKNSFPNKDATETDTEGAATFVNIPAGTAQAPRKSSFTTRLHVPGCEADHSKCPIIGTASVFLRPSTLTYVHVGPSP